MIRAPTAVLYDASGNAITNVLDGSERRLHAASKIAVEAGTSDLQYLEANADGSLRSTLYTTAGDAVVFDSVPSDPAAIQIAFVENGGSSDLRVDGSTTPVDFSLNAHATNDYVVISAAMVIVASSLTFGGSKFAGQAALTNGVVFSLTANNGQSGTIFTFKQNEDFIHFPTAGGFSFFIANKDVIRSAMDVGGAMVLEAGTADKVNVRVQDDLAGFIDYFRCCVRVTVRTP